MEQPDDERELKLLPDAQGSLGAVDEPGCSTCGCPLCE